MTADVHPELPQADGGAQVKGHAEVYQVWPRDGRIRIIGDIAAPRAPLDADWHLVLTLRGGEERRLRYPAPLDRGRFETVFPVADLVPAALPLPAQWDIHLTAQTSGGEVRLRAGRLLDDIQGKKKIMVFPAQRTPHPTGSALVKPYYTVKDNLSVQCLPQREPEEQPL